VEQRLPPPAARLAIALALAAAGGLGALATGGDAVDLLIWLAILAPAAGYLAGALGVGLLPYGLAAPGGWMVTLVVVAGWEGRDLATPLWAALAWTGLFAAGAGAGALGRALRGDPGWTGAGLLLLLATLLVALPGRGGATERPWPPAVARVLLDLSPATLVVESAGVDWMRHPSVYDPAGTARFQRSSYRGELAGPVALLVGCLLAAFARVVLARGIDRRRREE